MNSFQWVSSMQIMNCLEKEDFIECFGQSSGDWLWGKFTGPYRHDIAGFICYLDYGNAQKLYTFIMKRIEKMAPGMISAMTEAVIGKILIDGKEVGDVTMSGMVMGENEASKKAIRMIEHHITASGGDNHGSLISAIKILKGDI